MSVAPRPRRWAAPPVIIPKNPLEDMLVQLQFGKMAEEDIVRRLINLHVYVATDDVDVLDREDVFSPVVLEWTNGKYVAAFSHMDRVQTLVDGPGAGSVQMAFSELLERVPEGMGIVLNPNIGTTIDFSPKRIAALLDGSEAGLKREEQPPDS